MGSSAKLAVFIGFSLAFLGMILSVGFGRHLFGAGGRKVGVALSLIGLVYLVKTLGFYGVWVWMASIPVIGWPILRIIERRNSCASGTTPPLSEVRSSGSVGRAGPNRRSAEQIAERLNVRSHALRRHDYGAGVTVAAAIGLAAILVVGFFAISGAMGLSARETEELVARMAPLTEAIDDYRRRTGAYPDRLDAVVPSALPEVPRCPYLRPIYFRRADGVGYEITCITGVFVFPVAELRYDSTTGSWSRHSHDDPG
jgi:hypothetical protein